MRGKTRRVLLPARVLAVVFAALFAAAMLAGCDQIHSQIHEVIPHPGAAGAAAIVSPAPTGV